MTFVPTKHPQRIAQQGTRSRSGHGPKAGLFI